MAQFSKSPQHDILGLAAEADEISTNPFFEVTKLENRMLMSSLFMDGSVKLSWHCSLHRQSWTARLKLLSTTAEVTWHFNV